MLLEKLTGFDVGLWDHSILTPESKNLFASGTLPQWLRVSSSFFFVFFLMITTNPSLFQ